VAAGFRFLALLRRPAWPARLLLCAALAAPLLAAAQSPGPAWKDLSPAERRALQPLQDEWSGIDAARREKWREIASRFDRMSPDERGRVQQRMSDWVNLSPRERNEARQNYQGARQLSPAERQQRWEAYRALPEEQRRSLAERAGAEAVRPPRGAERAPAASGKANPLAAGAVPAPRPRAVAPSVLQATPGATTMPLSARPSPPLHQQAGLPKVAATPGFVDSKTLLPQRGPQGAATEPRRQAPGRSR
jgi:hypothetical protein